jgi:hypothetical protein
MRLLGWMLSFGLVIGSVYAQSPTNTEEQKLITIEHRSEKAFNTRMLGSWRLQNSTPVIRSPI